MKHIKQCFKCGESKPLSAFYRHKRMADGHLNKCKTCTKLDVLNHRELNIDRIRAYDRTRGNRQKHGYSKMHYRKNKEKIMLAQRKRRSRLNKEYRATNAVSNAVRDGRLVKSPCEACGSVTDIQGHHDDYSKPLDVRWLCPVHHGAVHRVINKRIRAAKAA